MASPTRGAGRGLQVGEGGAWPQGAPARPCLPALGWDRPGPKLRLHLPLGSPWGSCCSELKPAQLMGPVEGMSPLGPSVFCFVFIS